MADFSPLFRMASREIQAQARKAFVQSDIGQLARMVHAGQGQALMGPERFMRTLRRYTGDPKGAIRSLTGMHFGELTREVSRYSRGGWMGDLVKAFLGELGPAGRLIGALVSPENLNPQDAAQGVVSGGQLDRDIDSAIRFLEAFGFEVLPSHARSKQRVGDLNAGIEKAIAFLQEHGQEIPEGEGLPKSHAPKPDASGEVTLPGLDGPVKYPPNHPIITGDMLPGPSGSHVHSYGYDAEAAVLYIRFRFYDGATGKKTAGPGALYQYRDIDPQMFERLMIAPSKGEWIWEELRIRHTVAGYKKPYALVGVAGGYVPRHATFGYDPKSGKYGEMFQERTIRTNAGRWIKSTLSTEMVRPFTVAGPSKAGIDFGVR